MENIINDPRILINPEFLSKLSINISQCAENFSMKIPKELKTEKIIVDPDDTTYIAGDSESIKPSLMGTLIDYLTRIVICNDKSAFDFLRNIRSSWDDLIENINEAFADNHAYTPSDIETNIKKLNAYKVQAVVEVCKREQYFRSGNSDDIKQEYTVDDNLLKHIKKLLMRNKKFFDRFGESKIIGYHSHFGTRPNPVEYYGKSFDALHVFLKGDGDYLLSNALMDLKVSSSNNDKSFWKKQLLLYYLGLDQEELEENDVKYENIKYLINFNPRYNVAYKIYLQPDNTKLWFNIRQNIYLNIQNLDSDLQSYAKKLASDLKVRTIATFDQARRFKNPFLKYEDGIHQIAKHEYLALFNAPKIKGQLYLIKRNGFYMFLVRRHLVNGKYHLNILNGGTQYRATHDLQYYYDNLLVYGHTIELAFKKYQAFLVRLGSELRLLAHIKPSNIFSDTGRVHGSIVNIDYYNHIYVNPMTGKMKFYYAPSVSNRIVYPSFHSLLKNSSVDAGELMENNLKLLPDNSLLKLDESYHLELSMSEHTPELLAPKDSNQLNLKTQQDSYVIKPEYQYDQEMYSNSRAMTKIQKVLVEHRITFWNDQVLKDATRINEPKLNYRYRRSKSKVIDDASKESAYIEMQRNKKVKQSNNNTLNHLTKKGIAKCNDLNEQILKDASYINEPKLNQHYQKQRSKIGNDASKASAYFEMQRNEKLKQFNKKFKQVNTNTICYLTKKDIAKYSDPNGRRVKIKKINNLKLTSTLGKTIKTTSARIISNNYACFDENRTYLLSRNRNKLHGSVSSNEQKVLTDLKQNMKELFKLKLYNAHMTKMAFIKDKDRHNIAYYDLGFDNKLVILDLIKDFKINQELINNIIMLYKTTNKEIYLYKAALGKLYKLD